MKRAAWPILITTGCLVLPPLMGCGGASERVRTSAPAMDRGRAMTKLEAIPPIPRFPEGGGAPAAAPSPAAQRYLEKGREQFAQELYTEAVSSLERALKQEPRLTAARILLARACVQNGNQALAVGHLQEVLQDEPRSMAAHQLLGEIAWQNDRVEDAIRELRLTLLACGDRPKSPECVLAHLSLAMALRKEGYLQAALDELASYESAVRDPTPEMKAHRELGETMVLYRGKDAGLIAEIQTELGRHDLASAAYARAVAESPDDTTLRGRWIRSLVSAGRSDEALEVVRKMLAEFPEDSAGLVLLREVCDSGGGRHDYDAELLRLARAAKKTAFRAHLADLLIQRGRITEAVEVLSTLALEDPGNTAPRLQLARLRLRSGQSREALEALAALLKDEPSVYREVREILSEKGDDSLADPSRALAKENPNDAAVALLRGLVLLRRGPSPELDAAIARALSADRGFGPAWSLRAEMLILERKWDAAAEACDSAFEAGARDAEVYLTKGRALAALDEFDDAEAALVESFDRNRKSPEPLLVLAEMAERRGDMRRCEMLYRRILGEVDARFIPARERLVKLYLRSSRVEQADEYLSECARLKLSGPAIERCRAMYDLVTSKNPRVEEKASEYVKRLEKIDREHPSDVATLVDLAHSRVFIAELPQALALVDKALVIDPHDRAARELKADIQSRLLDFDAAAETFRVLLAERPRDNGYRRALLDLTLHNADFASAIPLLRQVLAGESRKEAQEVVRSQLIGLLLRTERFDEAVAEAGKWLEESPKDSSARGLWLDTLTGAKKRDEAIEAAREWLFEDPTNVELRDQYVRQLQLAERGIEAQQRVLAWLERDPDDSLLANILIRLFWASQDWDAAIETAQTGAELSSDRARYQNLLGQTYLLAKRYDEAIRFYQEQAKSSPSASSYRDWITVLVAAKRYEEAEKVVSGVLQTQLNRQAAREQFEPLLVVEMRRRLAMIYQLTDRDAQAVQQLEEVRGLMPDDPGINNDLGYSLADSGLRMEEAEKMVRLAVFRMPRESAYLDSLGWVLYKRGRFDEAIRMLERALRLRASDDAVFHDHLGDALYRAGRMDRARAEWEKAAKIIAGTKDDQPSLEYQRVREQTARKLKQLAEGRDVEVARLAGPPVTSQAAKPTSKPDAG